MKGGGSVQIFIVEDEEKIREELCSFLERNGFTCAYPSDFAQTAQQALRSGSQLILLDLSLPVYDGYYICREIRKESDVPIIIVTSRDTPTDELLSMNLGADDFITKPYNLQILLARINNLLKRTYQMGETLAHQGFMLNISKSIVEHNGKQEELTKNELRILHTLMKQPGIIVSRDNLMQELWQSDEFVDDNTLTVNINRLRKKLEAIGGKGLLQTKRGQGYRI